MMYKKWVIFYIAIFFYLEGFFKGREILKVIIETYK
jgi:hypothetical protein